MLKPIHHVACSLALRACRGLQERLLVWLCDPNTQPAVLIRANLPGPTQIEADWLWTFLNKMDAGRSLLERAQTVAGLSAADKTVLLAWGQAVVAVTTQFQANPPAWPHHKPAIPNDAWLAFKELMEAFYDKGLRAGLPYLADGTPVSQGGLNYPQFVEAFRKKHRVNPDADAWEICVLCGGPLDDVEVDHWIAKSAYPLLSVCADNLLPICGKCNSTDNKGSKPVYDVAGFTNWFHPYLRPGHGTIQLGYSLQNRVVTCDAIDTADSTKATNLDGLLNLAARWTKIFKAEYLEQMDSLRRREKKKKADGLPLHTQDEVRDYLVQEQIDLSPSKPYYEVHCRLLAVLLEQARLDAWQTELGLVN